MKENDLKQQEFNLCGEIKKQQDMLNYAVSITERILRVLRGEALKEEAECMRDECMIDTLMINSRGLEYLGKNLNEISRKIIGE